jgi:TonB family protein
VAAAAMHVDTTHVDTDLVRETTVTAGDAHISVSRQVGKPVGLRVETNAGTFALTADSAAISIVADSVAVLPDLVPASGKKHKPPTTKYWGLRSAKDTNTTFRFSRVLWDNRPDIELDLANGAWETFEILGDQTAKVLSALRGVQLDTTDTAHIRVEVRPAGPSQCKEWMLGFRIDTEFPPNCRDHVEREASPLGGNPSPRYPGSLQVAGVSGKVIMQFVIDTLGQVDHRTICVIRSDNPLFTMAVLQVLPQARFRPAEVDGRKVKELVETPYVFSMH